MADHLGLGLTRGDHFRGLRLDDKLCRFLGRKEWVRIQIRHLRQDEWIRYRASLQKLLLDLTPPKLPEDLTDRLLELGLAFMIDEFDRALIPLEFAFLSDAAWTLKDSLAQALVAYLSQSVLPRQLMKSTTSPARALHALAGIYVHLRQSWRPQVSGLSLRQLLAVETLLLSPSSQPASRLGALLGAGSPEVFSWPRYMRYHGSGSQNALQELLLLGLVRPKDLDPGSALKELLISIEAEKPVSRALPKLFKRFGRTVKPTEDIGLEKSIPPGNIGLDLQRFLVALSVLPPPATKDGTPSMIHVDRLARLMGLTQPYQRFLLAVAWDCGWLHQADEGESAVIGPTPEGAELISEGPQALKDIAVGRLATLPSWDETRTSPCRLGNPGPMTHLVGRLRGFLLELARDLEGWTPVSGLTSMLINLQPFRRLLATAPELGPVAEILNTPRGSSAPLLVSLASTLWWMQQIELTINETGESFVGPATPPEAVIATQAKETPSTLRIAASGEFFLPIVSPLDQLRQAAAVADILSIDQACRFRVTRASLARAQKSGATRESIEAFVGTEIPQNLLHALDEVFPD